MDWTPSPRRSSAMRREQNLAIVGAVLTGAVVATGIVLLLVARVNPSAGQKVRASALDLVAPLWSVVRAPFDGVGRMIDFGGDYFGAVGRVRALEAELASAEAKLQQASADQVALRQLKRLERISEPKRQMVATARIVSATPGATARTALVTAGRANGVFPGMPVLAANGLIGRTIEAGQNASRLVLLYDATSRVPVLVVRTGQAALVSGDGSPSLVLTDRVGPEDPLAPGDKLITSGEGGVFPPGIPVGTIIDIGPPIRVVPAASPLGAGYVRIERPFVKMPGSTDTAPVTDAPVPIEAQRVGGLKGAIVRGQDAPPAIQDNLQ